MKGTESIQEASQKMKKLFEDNYIGYVEGDDISLGKSDVVTELIKRGYVFESDTDTEVLVNLIEEIQKKTQLKLGEAVQLALKEVVGAYYIIVT